MQKAVKSEMDMPTLELDLDEGKLMLWSIGIPTPIQFFRRDNFSRRLARDPNRGLKSIEAEMMEGVLLDAFDAEREGREKRNQHAAMMERM